MPKITFLPSGESIEFSTKDVPFGDHGESGSILDVALHHGIEIPHNCGGFGACGMCQVIIREGMESLSEMNDLEENNVDLAFPATPDSRLACQAVIQGDVTVEIPER